jgi:membrane fusion protein, copper/silver efflux system
MAVVPADTGAKRVRSGAAENIVDAVSKETFYDDLRGKAHSEQAVVSAGTRREVSSMRKAATIILLLLSIVGMFLVGSWYSQRTVVKTGSMADRKVLYYVDPMNPSHTSDKPGMAPCGMPMEPVYAEEEKTAGDAMSPGAVTISSQKQQLLGVRVSPVEETSHTHPFRTIGRVAPDETRVHRILAGIEGFIREVSEVTTGDHVKKDQRLATFSSPNALSVIQIYILNLGAVDRIRQSAADGSVEAQAGPAGTSNLQQRIDQMENLGMSVKQMEEIERTRLVPASIRILAPVDGVVLARNVSPGLKFDRGAEWYRIADLSRVWVVADVFEREAQYIQPGMSAKISLPHRGKVFDATVTHVPPQFDPLTRTLKVRLEMDNAEDVLRPDMVVDVEFLIHFPPVVTVSADAVLDSGIRKTVFVVLGDGRFEPRAVETGWRFDDQVEIVRGLTPGERIVTSGNFLIDSESRMKLAAQGLYGTPELDPVCAMDVYPQKAKAAGLTTEFDGRTYYFCSPECKAQFEKEHPSHASMPGDSAKHGQPSIPEKRQLPAGITMDGVCRMYVQEEKAKANKLVRDYKGRTYYFCSTRCLREFDQNPERYVGKGNE